MNSYLTQDELLNFYPNTSEYAPEQIDMALTNSYSMINSFLDGNYNIPVVGQDGVIPGIVKVMQSRFAQYLLEFTNNGWSNELQNLLDNTIVLCKGLGANELLISEVSTTGQEVGWNLIDSTLTLGKVFIEGEAPELETTYTFTMTENSVPSGLYYVADTEWEVVRSDSASVLYTLTGNYEWQDVDGYLRVRLDGQFMYGETFKVKGVPSTADIKSINPIIKQSTVMY